MKSLLRYLRNYKLESIIGPLFKLTEAIFELIVPMVMSDIIDIGIANNDSVFILKKGALLVFFGLMGLACSLTAQYFAAKASVGFGTELRHDMFRYIMDMSFTEHDEQGAATLINRLMTDVNQLQSGVNLALRLLLRSPFIVIGAVIMAFTIDVKLALIFLVATPVIALIVFIIMVRTIPKFKAIQDKLDKVLGLSRWNLNGIRVIRAFGRQQEEQEGFEKTTEELMELQVGTGRISALINPLSYALLNVAIILVLWFGAISVDTGRITQGEVIALVNYLSQILLALIAMVNLVNSFTKAIASAGRISEVFPADEYNRGITADVHENTEGKADTENVNSDNCRMTDSTAPAIEFDRVSFAYEGADNALTDISFKLGCTQTLGIIGGTGAGKTTLVNLLTGFYKPDSGVIRIHGRSTQELTSGELRKMCSVVPQKKHLFSGTIRDNLKFGREASDEELMRAVELSQAAEFVNREGVGLDYVIEAGGTNLSGGQKQRLTIARALVNANDILILDDSASALDYSTENALRKAIAGLDGTLSTVIVSQRIGSIMGADRILVLDDGEVAGFGTHEELLKGCPVYREIYDSQSK